MKGVVDILREKEVLDLLLIPIRKHKYARVPAFKVMFALFSFLGTWLSVRKWWFSGCWGVYWQKRLEICVSCFIRQGSLLIQWINRIMGTIWRNGPHLINWNLRIMCFVSWIVYWVFHRWSFDESIRTGIYCFQAGSQKVSWKPVWEMWLCARSMRALPQTSRNRERL